MTNKERAKKENEKLGETKYCTCPDGKYQERIFKKKLICINCFNFIYGKDESTKR